MVGYSLHSVLSIFINNLTGESSVLHFDGDETSGRGPAMGISHESILAAGEVVMCHFVLRSSPSPTIAEVVNEYDVSCVQHGMMQMRFNRQNKITNIEMMFDVMGFMQQLQVRDDFLN